MWLFVYDFSVNVSQIKLLIDEVIEFLQARDLRLPTYLGMYLVGTVLQPCKFNQDDMFISQPLYPDQDERINYFFISTKE